MLGYIKNMNITNRISAICFIVIIWGSSISSLFAQSIKFNHLTVEDGLSNNDVNTVVQDRTGFIWFGTDDGLNRYDGYNFKVFRHNPDDSNSISDNSIWSLTEDKEGNIWIGTKAGVLNKFNPVSERFTRWKIESESIVENSIKAIFEDRQSNIWVGTYKDGLYRLNQSDNTINHWHKYNSDPKSLSHNYVQSIIEDNNGNIIIGTYIGLNIFNPTNPENGFRKYYNEPNNKYSLSNNLIWSLSQSSIDSNIIWIGTHNNITRLNTSTFSFERITVPNTENIQYGTSCGYIIEEIIDGERIIWSDSYAGLFRKNLNTGKTKRYLHDENNEYSLISNQINKIIKDRTGVFWLATENGISYTTPKSNLFNSLDFSSSVSNPVSSLQKKNITAISKSGDKRVWIGTSDGLYSLDNISTDQQLLKISEFEGVHIWSLAASTENELWVGTYGKGLKKFDFKNYKITSWDIDDPRIGTQALYYNKSLLTDSKKNIWVGYWGVGTARINPQTGNADVWLNEPGNTKSLSHNDVWVIKEDQLGRIWIGTQGGGLNLFEDKNGGIFHHWLRSGENKNNLSSNNIYSICEAKKIEAGDDSITILWIGTSDGLNRFEIKNSLDVYDIEVKNQFYMVNDGLPANSVNSIVEDEKGNLWLGTGFGISFFDVSKKTFTNFSSADGINGTMMNPESALSLDNGLILFGSTKGLNVFNPEDITLSSYKPNLVITDFQIFNKSVKISDDSPLTKSIHTTNKIVLSHDQDVFSFEFAALDYNSSESIEYAYKMEGFDKDWIESRKRRFVTYTNLDPGNYEFKVKSTNADGVWNDNITSLRIVMNPPWWKTFWAYGLYIVLIFLGLVGIRRFELNRTKLRNELKLREFEVKKKSELEELKSRFFANLSHEFRTPLMLIKGPIEQLKGYEASKIFQDNIDLIERNSDRLKELIDQLLELSQLEKAAIPLRAKQENVITILKGLLSSFESFAKQKNISLKFQSDSDNEVCWVDRDKFEKIINNLLSNAFKFTPDGGMVSVGFKENSFEEKSFAQIKIADSGVGIPKDKINKIFDRFFQVDDSTKRSHGGSGIGLALVKEFVDLHKWNISVVSEPGEGTEFTIQIPLWDDYLNDDEKVQTGKLSDTERAELKISEDEKYLQSFHRGKRDISIKSNDKPLILLVDDSEDVRKYLSNLLENNFKISEAENGEEGIKAAKEMMPDLIISDVMMPSMDGLEFCSRIKSEWQTSDVPIILLTAKASLESKIEGLETGADDYLTKPFDSRELFSRINNLLEQRKRLREKYSDNINALKDTNGLNTADNEFLQKTLDLVEKNIDKTNFGTEQLAKELFVSRTQLHRKIISITGQPPGELIRNKKLNQAAQLLLEGKLSVTQIAYEIGFSSPAQFTRAFTKQFNCLPSEYSS